MVKYIKSAEGTSAKEEVFNDNLAKCRDDFSYAADGLERLFAENQDAADEILRTLQSAIDSVIAEVSAQFAE